MSTKQNTIGFYKDLTVKKRIIYLLDHYKHREYYEESQRRYIEGMIADIRAYERNRNEELGVRIMSGGSMSDITSAAAEESIKIEKAFIAGAITETLIKDKDDRELILEAIDEWLVMKDDYASLDRVMWKLPPNEHDLIMAYLSKEKDYHDIAKEYMIEFASAKKKVHRIRENIGRMVSPDIERHGLRWSKVAG